MQNELCDFTHFRTLTFDTYIQSVSGGSNGDPENKAGMHIMYVCVGHYNNLMQQSLLLYQHTLSVGIQPPN